MDNTTALLARHQPLLANRSTLLVETDDGALPQLLPHASVHTDNFLIARQCARAQFSAWPTYQGEERLVLPLPKAHDRLIFLLTQLAGQLTKPVECWLVGPANGGIKGALKHFSAAADQVALKDSARHCKLYTGLLQPRPTQDFWQHFEVNGKTIASLPGVFSHGKLDEGSALLLTDLMANPVNGKKVLDVGCGAGVLTVHLASATRSVTAVDVSATALAACQQALRDNDCQAELIASDLLSDVKGRFHAIISNPPFHAGMTRDINLARRLIEQSRAQLVGDGELRLVANRNLPYHDWLSSAFQQVTIQQETPRFRVWRARQPR